MERFKYEKPLPKLNILIQHLSDLEISHFSQNQEHDIYTSRGSDTDSSKLDVKDKSETSTSIQEKTSLPTGKPQPDSSNSPETPGIHDVLDVPDVLDLSQPSSQTIVDVKQTQALD